MALPKLPNQDGNGDPPFYESLLGSYLDTANDIPLIKDILGAGVYGATSMVNSYGEFENPLEHNIDANALKYFAFGPEDLPKSKFKPTSLSNSENKTFRSIKEYADLNIFGPPPEPKSGLPKKVRNSEDKLSKLNEMLYEGNLDTDKYQKYRDLIGRFEERKSEKERWNKIQEMKKGDIIDDEKLIDRFFNINLSSGKFDLGTKTTSIGRDESGHYISIYDKYDFGPEYAESYVEGEDIKEMGARMLDKAGHPFEIYDRFYFDPETGEQVRPKVTEEHSPENNVPETTTTRRDRTNVNKNKNKNSFMAGLRPPLPEEKLFLGGVADWAGDQIDSATDTIGNQFDSATDKVRKAGTWIGDQAKSFYNSPVGQTFATAAGATALGPAGAVLANNKLRGETRDWISEHPELAGKIGAGLAAGAATVATGGAAAPAIMPAMQAAGAAGDALGTTPQERKKQAAIARKRRQQALGAPLPSIGMSTATQGGRGQTIAYGGYVEEKLAHGGKTRNIGQDAKKIKGPKHEQGGVQLDQNTEVEGGETMDTVNGNKYVFSDRLTVPREVLPEGKQGMTFADYHQYLVENNASPSTIQELAEIQEREAGRDNNSVGNREQQEPNKKMKHLGPMGQKLNKLASASRKQKMQDGGVARDLPPEARGRDIPNPFGRESIGMTGATHPVPGHNIVGDFADELSEEGQKLRNFVYDAMDAVDKNVINPVANRFRNLMDGDEKMAEGGYYAVKADETEGDEPKYPINSADDVRDAWKLRNHGDYNISQEKLENRIKRKAREYNVDLSDDDKKATGGEVEYQDGGILNTMSNVFGNQYSAPGEQGLEYYTGQEVGDTSSGFLSQAGSFAESALPYLPAIMNIGRGLLEDSEVPDVPYSPPSGRAENTIRRMDTDVDVSDQLASVDRSLRSIIADPRASMNQKRAAASTAAQQRAQIEGQEERKETALQNQMIGRLAGAQQRRDMAISKGRSQAAQRERRQQMKADEAQMNLIQTGLQQAGQRFQQQQRWEDKLEMDAMSLASQLAAVPNENVRNHVLGMLTERFPEKATRVRQLMNNQ